MRVNWPRLNLPQNWATPPSGNPLPQMTFPQPVADVRLPRRFPVDHVPSHGVVREDGVKDSGLVRLLTHDFGPVRHKGVAVAAGEARHPDRLGIPLMLKENRQIFLHYFAERNNHLIRPDDRSQAGRVERARSATETECRPWLEHAC